MFEALEVGNKLTKTEFEELIPELRVNLINAQYDLREADFPVVVLIAGIDRVGANDLLHSLHDMMDGRYMRTNALGRPRPEELERPRFWRYWNSLPRKGEIGVYLGAWPLNTIQERLAGDLDGEAMDRRLRHMTGFEQDLAADGALVLKFWLHLPKAKFKRRLKSAKKHSRQAWRVEPEGWATKGSYKKILEVSERVIRETETDEAPWHLVESTNNRYRNAAVAEIILESLTRRLLSESVDDDTAAPAAAVSATGLETATVLDTVDLTKRLSRDDYRHQRHEYQSRVRRLTNEAMARGISSVLMFEGWDAAGKGGVIRRITQGLNPELYDVYPVAAPTPEELAHPYLWRFWRRLPRAGNITIFDRSWYGRVLVERVEGFATEVDWQRAYHEINDFEQQLCESGIQLLKFWLHIDPDEQLRRFQDREATPYKKYKITDEDYRNREQWSAYESAVHDMVLRTSTDYAPWHLVPSNSKRWARIQALETYCSKLEQAL